MSELDMNPATLPADARELYAAMAARRKAQGEGFGGPYLALLNHPEVARRVEEPRPLPEVRRRAAAHDLSVHRAHGRARHRRRLRVARPHRTCARRRLAGGGDRLHRYRPRRGAAAALYIGARHPGEDDDVA